MHMVPVAVLPEPSVKESIMGVRVNNARKKIHFIPYIAATGSVNSVSDVGGVTVSGWLRYPSHRDFLAFFQPLISCVHCALFCRCLSLPLIALISVDTEMEDGISSKERSSFALLILS